MELHTVLCVSSLFRRCAVLWWIVVRCFRLRQCPLDLSRRDKSRGLDSPNLHDLTSKLGCQEREHCWVATVICNPHQVSVDQNGKVMPAIVGGSSVADVCNWHVLSTCPGETVQRARYSKGPVRVQGSFVLGQDPIVGDCSVDVCHQDGLVICQELAEALIGPVVHELLPSNLIEELIRVVHNER